MTQSKSRTAILEAARAEFGEHGYAGARISRIAERSGLNKQLIYYYFGSKADLYAAATAPNPAAHHPAELAPAPDASAPDSVRAALAALLEGLAQRPDIVALVVDRRPSREAQAQARAWIEQVTRDLAAAVSRGQGMGYFRDDVDPRAAARQALVSCIGFLAIQRYLDADAETWLRGISETLLRASRW